MGVFINRQQRARGCDMCGSTEGVNCDHVVEIRGDDPPWLPVNWRLQAQGEWTFFCVRCDSFPAMKWPTNAGAHAGMLLHLGSDHDVGMMKFAPHQFDMVNAR